MNACVQPRGRRGRPSSRRPPPASAAVPRPRLTIRMPPSFKPAYLIHGDDHGRIAERRARLRELAERQSGVQGLELFEGDASAPEQVAAALNTMTFAIGRRFLIVDGVERWKDKELDELADALAHLPPETTIAFFAREDGRLKAPPRLHKAVERTGGDISAESSIKP